MFRVPQMPTSPPDRGVPESTPVAAEEKTRSELAEVVAFVSYNSEDHEIAERIARGLSDRGIKPFLDRWDLAPGLRWRSELEGVLASCQAVAVCLGPNGMGEVQKREVDVALRRQDKDPDFPVVPVVLPGAETPTGFLEQLTWIDLRDQTEADGIEDLARALRGEWSKQPRRARDTRRHRYLLNFLLLLIVLVLAGLWYGRHLHTRLAHAAVGGSVTLLALLRLAYDWFRWSADNEIKGLTRRWLGSVTSTWVLAGLLGAALFLILVTSSLHLELDPAQRQGGGYAVEMRGPRSRVLWKSPRLAGDKIATSRLFFFRFGTPCEVSLVPDADMAPVRVRLGPWASIRLQVPSQFQPREVEVVRLLPAGRLLAVLGTPAEPVSQRMDLLVVSGGRTNRIPDLRRQAVYLAGSSNDISLALRRETDSMRQERFRNYALRVLSAQDEPLSADLVRRWETLPRSFVPDGWSPAVELQFYLLPEDRPQMEALTVTPLDHTNGIRTLAIERAP